MAKTITPELMTSEECEVINQTVKKFRDDLDKQRDKAAETNMAMKQNRANKVAKAKVKREKLIYTAVRAVCFWLALMIILVPMVRFGHISLMVMDLVIYPVTLWVGICVGRLLRK